MAIAKLVFCSTLATASLIAFWLVRGKSWEEKLYRNAVFILIPVKFALCIFLYTFLPELNKTSDAALYYFPQALDFLSGKIPYRDFQSCYSILFLPLLSIPILLWESIGSIVLTMLTAETVMLYIYLRRSPKPRHDRRWLTVFLYSFSPISFYWIGLVGYNGALIAFFVMWSLALLVNGKSLWSGIAAAFGFLFTKMLAILAWPALIIIKRQGLLIRAIPIILALILTLSLSAIGIDTLMPVKAEISTYTSGNLWFLISVFFPGFKNTLAWKILPIVSFSIILIPLLWKFMKRRSVDTIRDFDAAVAFIAAANLLFMILSKKTYTMYMPMMLIFIIHTLTVRSRFGPGDLISLAYLGSVTTYEMHLFMVFRDGGESVARQIIIGLVAADMAMLLCYIYLSVICLKVSFGWVSGPIQLE
jgi:hypothetical protein